MHYLLKKYYDLLPRSANSQVSKEIKEFIDAVNKDLVAVNSKSSHVNVLPFDFLKHLPEPAYALNTDGIICGWNPAMEKLTGVNAELALGKGNFEAGKILYGKRYPSLIDIIRGCSFSEEISYSFISRNGESLTAESQIRNSNGHQVNLLVQATPVHDASGNLIGAYETIRDISPFKQSERITTLLYQIAAELNSSEHLTDFFKFIHKSISKLITAESFMVALVDDERSELMIKYLANNSSCSINSEKVEKCLNFEQIEFCEDILSSGQPKISENRNFNISAEDHNCLCSLLGVPLRADNQVIGVMVSACSKENYTYGKDDRDLLLAISEQVASSIQRRNTELELKKSEERYRSIFENATECIFQVSLNGQMEIANPATAALLGFESSKQLLEERPDPLTYFLDKNDFLKFSAMLLRDGYVNEFYAAVNNKSAEKWAVINARIISGKDGTPLSISGFAFDVTSQVMAQRKVSRHKSRFKQLFDGSPQGIVIMDVQGEIIDTNPSFEALFGYSTAQMSPLCSNLYTEHNQHIIAEFRKVLSGGTVNYEAVRQDSSGNSIPVSILGYPFINNNKISGAFFIYNDISPRKKYERELSHQSLHDSLTGLPNRVLFLECLKQALNRSQSEKDHTFAVMMLDIDMFKRINDSLGHIAGDELLIKTGGRIKKCLRPGDNLARMGSDEFAILIEDFSSPQQVIKIIKKIRNEMHRPVNIKGNEIFVTSSIGIVFKTAEYTNPEHVLRDADISMYRAKQLGSNRFKVFNKAMHETAIKNLEIETDIRQGLPKNEFIPYFQPVYRLSDSRLAGFEALMRWEHPLKGLVGPDKFIPIAEDTGLIVSLDREMLRKSCYIFSKWLKSYSKSSDLFLNVNLSPRQLSRHDLIDAINDVLTETNFPSRMLKLEITESAIMESNSTTATNLEKIGNLGIRLAVDDFGTGYSSLSQLQRFPASTVKIDRSFVSGMVEDVESLEIVKAVYALGHSLGMEVIAEGVENRKQLALLHEIGCEFVQGFYFDKPVNAYDAEEIVKLMNSGFRHPGLNGI